MNTIKNRYENLSGIQKARVRLAWRRKFKLSERQFSNRLNVPTAEDYAFWAIVYNLTVDELMEHLKDSSVNTALLQTQSEIIAPNFSLTIATS